MRTEPLPVTYRASEVEQILAALRAGDSCSVVGIGSVGKSNLMRFLQREDVHRAYLDDDGDQYLFVYVDVNKLLKQSFWGLLELMLHQLMLELANRDADQTILQTIDELHRRATAAKTQHLALRYLDRAIGVACNQLDWRLVFLIDEFDELCRTMPPRSFAALRALRDDYKYRLMYVVATRLELKRLRAERLEIEPFEELFSSHTIWLGPYVEDDARLMLRRLAARHSVNLDQKTENEVLSVTGRHPGLMREAYHTVREQSSLFETLVRNSRGRDECQRIWFSLSPEEQQAMVDLANNVAAPASQDNTLERLRRKGLVSGPPGDKGQIFSPLFAEYIQRQHPTVGERIYVDHERHTVWVNGYEIGGLTPLEYNLIRYLEKKRGQVCSRDELVQVLYPEDAGFDGEGVTDTRLDSVVKRLRKRIEPKPKEPRYIVTLRGHGFRLVDEV